MLHCDGSWPADKARMARLVDRGLSNPPTCLTECAKIALTKMLPQGLTYCDEATVDICVFLEIFASSEDLWGLYWCDSTFCGVANHQPRRLGQDPTVNRIINQCQNLGHSGIIDPGPPPESYACSFYIDEPFDSDGQCDDDVTTVQADPVSKLISESFVGQATGTNNIATASLSLSIVHGTISYLVMPTRLPSSSSSAESLWVATESQPTLPSTMTASAVTPPTTPSIKPNVSSESSSGAGSSAAAAAAAAHNQGFKKTTTITQGQLSIGSLAAIAVCVPVSLVILGFLACYLWRRKKQRKTDSFQRDMVQAHLGHNQQHPCGPRASAVTTTCLITKANGSGSKNKKARSAADLIPLSPPPRLRDRKYLDSIFKRAESPPLTPLGPAEGGGPSRNHIAAASSQHVFWDKSGIPASPLAFPTSPIFSSTVSKWEQRREQTLNLHPTSPVSNPFADHEPQPPPRTLANPEFRRTSTGSVGSGLTFIRTHAASSLWSEYVPTLAVSNSNSNSNSSSRHVTAMARMPRADTPPPSPMQPQEERHEIPGLLLFRRLAASSSIVDSDLGLPVYSNVTTTGHKPLGLRKYYSPSRSSERILPCLPRSPSPSGYKKAYGHSISPKSDIISPARHRAASPIELAKTSTQLRGEARALWEHTETCAREARDAPKIDQRTIAAEAAALRGAMPVFDLSEKEQLV